MINDDDRPIRRRKSSTTWTFINPEERTISTASQLNAQNQKVKRGLDVVGIRQSSGVAGGGGGGGEGTGPCVEMCYFCKNI